MSVVNPTAKDMTGLSPDWSRNGSSKHRNMSCINISAQS
jgi:hypothetical protein